MAFSQDFNNSRNWRAWQTDPSTRTAVQPWDRYVPFSGSVSTSAADILTLGGPYLAVDQGGAAGTVATWEKATTGSPGLNRITNPSIENATISAFTADGSAISRTTANPHLGSAELTANPANSAAKEGFYVTTDPTGGSVNVGGAGVGILHIVASGMVRGASASGDAVMQITNSSGTVLATGDAVSLTTTYQRVTATYNIPAGSSPATYRVKFCSSTQHNIDMYWDALMYDFREDSNVIDYIDGSLAGGNGYEWAGTANLSVSRHTSTMGVIRGITIRNTHASNILYVAFDCEAEASTAAIKLTGNDTTEHTWFQSTHPLDFRKNVSVIASGSSTTYEGVIWGVSAPVG